MLNGFSTSGPRIKKWHTEYCGYIIQLHLLMDLDQHLQLDDLLEGDSKNKQFKSTHQYNKVTLCI
jgi:hypothetical protein